MELKALSVQHIGKIPAKYVSIAVISNIYIYIRGGEGGLYLYFYNFTQLHTCHKTPPKMKFICVVWLLTWASIGKCLCFLCLIYELSDCLKRAVLKTMVVSSYVLHLRPLRFCTLISHRDIMNRSCLQHSARHITRSLLHFKLNLIFYTYKWIAIMRNSSNKSAWCVIKLNKNVWLNMILNNIFPWLLIMYHALMVSSAHVLNIFKCKH